MGQYLVFIGAAVQLFFGIFPYLIKTLKGTVKPNRVTWLMWSIAPLIGTAAAVADHVGWAALIIFVAGFGPVLVFIASFLNKQAFWQLQRSDYWCGLLSLLALVFWQITKQPSVAIGFAVLSDGLAAIPTLVKSWNYPETEAAAPYAVGIFTSSTSFTAIKIWNFSSLAFPIYFITANSLLTFAILHNKIIKPKV